ncbi:MAG: radical SAM protein [Elusimicrobia bacterium]|nr:radical SAM protein [Elusimicrobiota bacterium]
MRVGSFQAPVAVAWQLTNLCDLSCRHCLNDSGPGGGHSSELSRAEVLRVSREIAACQVPYVLFCGGEPMLSPHFWAAAEALGKAGVWLKVETNGQRLDPASARRLAKLPIRSVQVSLDGVTQEAYESLRPGAELSAALEACRFVRRAGMPLEIAFVPTRANIHEAPEVIETALELGAFRFNTGTLIRRGRAAEAWADLSVTQEASRTLLATLTARETSLAGRLELCFRPFSFEEQVRAEATEPSGTLTVLPDGRVRLSSASDSICADLRTHTLLEAWRAYVRASVNGTRSEKPAGLCLGPATRS